LFAPGIAKVHGKDAQPEEGEPQSRLRLEYSSRGRVLGWLELAEIASPVASVSGAAAANKPALFARSELTLGWNKLSGDGTGLIAEGLKLAGAKP
jgi:hypothetical protein